MPTAIPFEIREQARALFIAGKPISEIGVRLSVKPHTVERWAGRYGWLKMRDETQMLVREAVCSVVVNGMFDEGVRVRKTLAGVIAKQAQRLHDEPPRRVSALQSKKGTEGLASVVQRVVSSAETVFGWGSEGSDTLVLSLNRLPEPGYIPGGDVHTEPKQLTAPPLEQPPAPASPVSSPDVIPAEPAEGAEPGPGGAA